MPSYIPYCSKKRKRKVSTAVIMAPWYNSTLPSVSTLIAMADPSTSYGQWRERERERERERKREKG